MKSATIAFAAIALTQIVGLSKGFDDAIIARGQTVAGESVDATVGANNLQREQTIPGAAANIARGVGGIGYAGGLALGKRI